jgi:hypothetical protein
MLSPKSSARQVLAPGSGPAFRTDPDVREEGDSLCRVIPWLIFGLILVPLLIVAFVAARRRTAAAEHPAGETAEDRAEMEREFADAEAYQAKWRDEDRARYDDEERFF